MFQGDPEWQLEIRATSNRGITTTVTKNELYSIMIL
jgi:hypothetical protein